MPVSPLVVERLTREGVWDPVLERAAQAFWYHAVDQLQDERIRAVVTGLLEREIAWQFFLAPASSSGRNHTAWQNGSAGLVRHVTEMAIGIWRIAQAFPECADARGMPSPAAMDMLLTGVILHDAWKGGVPWEDQTHPDHHAFAARAWKTAAQQAWLPPATIENVYTAIWWHGGRWTPGWDGNPETLGTRTNVYANVLHLCDMVYSDTNLPHLFAPAEIPLAPVRKR